MKSLDLKKYPDSCLRSCTKTINGFDSQLQEIIREMKDIMYANNGVGLAGPQVGLDLSIFLMDAGDGLVSFINPEITEVSKEKTPLEEGCLSLPGLTVNVFRPSRVTIKAQNSRGQSFTMRLSGLKAKIVQHEFDHLKGRMIIDYMNPVKKFMSRISFNCRKHGEKTCEVLCHVRKNNKRRY